MKSFFNVRLRLISTMCLAIIVVFAMSGQLFALEPKDKWEGSIDYAATGGSFLEDLCQASVFDCFPGKFDGQGDTITKLSSSELLGVPADANVVKAYLVWMGSIQEGGSADFEVSFQPPQGQTYPIKADADNDVVYHAYDGKDVNDDPTKFSYYTARVDITSIMRGHYVTQSKPLEGMYTVSGYEGYSGEPFKLMKAVVAGWSMFIVYSVPGAQAKRIYFYTDFRAIRDDVITLTPTGFQAPDNPEAKVTLFTGEGDDDISGSGTTLNSEEITFNEKKMIDKCNEVEHFFDNPFNSTINTNTSKDPAAGVCRYEQYSIDLDTFYVSTAIKLGDTKANIKFSLGQDLILTNYFLLSINSKLPDFDIPNEPEKTASVDTEVKVYPGQEFTYYLHVENNGEDVATKVLVRDDLSPDVTYVPGTTVVVEPNGERRKIEDIAGTPHPHIRGIPIADNMPPGPEYRRTVEIGVKVNQNVNKETKIDNLAEIVSGSGDIYFTNGGVAVRHGVRMEAFEGSLHFGKGSRNPGSRFVSAGDKSIVISHINLKALEGDVQLNSFAFSSKEGSNALMVDSASLWWDKNNNGTLEEAEDTQLGSPATWSSGLLEFRDLNALSLISANQMENLLLLVNVSAEATQGSQVELQLTEENVSVRGKTAGLPFTTGKLIVPGADVDVSVELGFGNPASGYLSPGTTTPVMQLKLRSYNGDTKVDQIQVRAEGTVYEPTELTQIQLIDDLNGDGVADAGEPELTKITIGTDDGIGAFAQFSLDLTAGTAKNVLLVAQFSADVLTDKTFRLSINSNDMISAGGKAVFGAPIEGSMFTFADTVVNCTKDDECVTALGAAWYCDLLKGICDQTGNPVPDGDTTDGVGPNNPDGDVDDDQDGTTEEEDGGGGCSQSNFHSVVFVMFFMLILGALKLRRKEQ